MQDLEFTIQQNKLYILQTRNGGRTALAALRIAVEMVRESKIDKKAALQQVDPAAIPSLLAPVFVQEPKRKAIAAGRLVAQGLNAGPGAAAGKIVFDSHTANLWAARGEAVILVRQENQSRRYYGYGTCARYFNSARRHDVTCGSSGTRHE